MPRIGYFIEVDVESIVGIHAERRTRKDDADDVGIVLWELVVRHDFTEGVEFTDTASDELSGLRTKV